MTITEFLLARIAEDEANIEGDWLAGDGGLHIISTPMHERLTRECAAKRRIVERAQLYADASNLDHFDAAYATGLDYAVEVLAAVYADHPDYGGPGWR